MPELTDYSGPYRHDLRFEDFSKDFLIKLLYTWQRAYLRLNAFWYQAVTERFGSEAADSANLEVWLQVGEKMVPKYAKVGNFPLNTVVDSLKICQLVPETNIGSEYFDGKIDIKNENHIITTTTKCGILDALEKAAPEKIEYFCHVLEGRVLEKYFSSPTNPNVTVTPLKLPPRKSPKDICCQFEIKAVKGKKKAT
jgi:hypothetical protein